MDDQEAQTPVEGDFNTIKENPEALLQLINKYVKVKLIMNTWFNGFLHSIDPVTHSTILSVPKEDVYQTTLIPGHAILNISEMTCTISPPSLATATIEADQEILLRKSKLTEWFKKNLLPVCELKDKIVVGTVNILSPYKHMDIYADNPVIALQIRKIMEKMPQDFEPDIKT